MTNGSRNSGVLAKAVKIDRATNPGAPNVTE